MEFDEICQSFFRVDDTMIFSFYDHEFYQDSENNLCYGKLLLIDFKNFINEEDETKNGSIGKKLLLTYLLKKNDSCEIILAVFEIVSVLDRLPLVVIKVNK